MNFWNPPDPFDREDNRDSEPVVHDPDEPFEF